MNNDISPSFALKRLLCAKAASTLKSLEQNGITPDPRLMAAVEAKLAYLQGRMSSKQLAVFFEAAEEVRMQALVVLNNPLVVNKNEARTMYWAAEAAACAASNEQGQDVYDAELEEMLESFLATEKR